MLEYIDYTIVGFKDKNKMATFYKEGYTKIGAMRVFNKMKNSNLYQCITLRKEKHWWNDCCSSGVILVHEI